MILYLTGSGDALNLHWLDTVQNMLKFTKHDRKQHKEKKERKPESDRRMDNFTTDAMLQHIHRRFSELAESTLAAANAAVTSETEARAMVNTDKKGALQYMHTLGSHFYAPLQRRGILLCTCPSVGRYVGLP